MMPQSNFMVVAPVAAGHIDDLRQLLASMNRGPGVVDPQNALVPFGHLPRLHFARIAVLEDLSLNDITAYGLPRVNYPTYLTFLGDFDGSYATFIADLVQRAGDGLRRIFSHCEDFTPSTDLAVWLKTRNVSPATIYVNWIGRTTQQVREEEALRQAMEKFLQDNSASLHTMAPRQVYDTLNKFVAAEQQAGRITLTPPEPTPLGWKIRNFLHLVGVPLSCSFFCRFSCSIFPSSSSNCGAARNPIPRSPRASIPRTPVNSETWRTTIPPISSPPWEA